MSREAMQMALTVLERTYKMDSNDPQFQAVKALCAALAQPDVPETAFGKTKPVAMKFQIYKQTPPRGRELEPIHSALLPWVYDQDPSSGNTASMWVTPVATLPPQRKPLSDEEMIEIMESCTYDGGKVSWNLFARAIEAAHGIKEKNNG